jgi:hypothetical protein
MKIGAVCRLSIREDDTCDIDFNGVRLEQGKPFSSVMIGLEKRRFKTLIEECSRVLTDESQLEAEWRKLVRERRANYLGKALLPGKAVFKLCGKAGVARLLRLSGRKSRLFGNWLRCPSHRELLLSIFEGEFRDDVDSSETSEKRRMTR